ncbi:hypothetical protein K501DRAFT_237196 [Backusella circina FSU 941]|nr:hypothetical protein K501DRAFT_237196 [Backusella circina FSU 941]
MEPTLTEQVVESSQNSHQTENNVETEQATAILNTSIDRAALSPHADLKQRKKEKGSTTITTTTTTTTATTTTSANEQDEYNGGGFYECNICFDTAIHPVLTLCGHLFCWTCLAQWLNAQSRNPTCPVCKAGSGTDKVIPVYGRGKEESDPRKDPSIPTRPAGQRPAPLHDPNRPVTTSFFSQPFGNNAFNRGQFSVSGFGFFPLGMALNGTASNQQSPQGAFLYRLVMMLFSLLVIAIIFS